MRYRTPRKGLLILFFAFLHMRIVDNLSAEGGFLVKILHFFYILHFFPLFAVFSTDIVDNCARQSVSCETFRCCYPHQLPGSLINQMCRARFMPIFSQLRSVCLRVFSFITALNSLPGAVVSFLRKRACLYLFRLLN